MAVTVKWIGDKFVFTVSFRDKDDNPIVLDAVSAAPGGKAFLGTTPQGVEMSLANGKVAITDAPNGVAVYTLDAEDYENAVKFDVTGAKPNYNRLQAYIVGTDSEHITYAVAEVPVLDPRTADLSVVPEVTTIIAIIGPQGPRGLPGNEANLYEKDFPMPLTQWIIPHGLNKYPAIVFIDTANDLFGVAVNYIDRNTAVANFDLPTAGRACCN